MRICARNLIRAIGLLLIVSGVAQAQRAMTASLNTTTKHWVRLSWTPVTEDTESEPLAYSPWYNVYRSTTSGSGYSKITASPIPNPFYRDDSAAPGTEYFYVVRTVIPFFPGAAYDSGETYGAGVAVQYGGQDYLSKVADNIGNQPDTSPVSWMSPESAASSEVSATP